ncbi:MAG: thiol-disulfide oxidoreductase DCC family protein [Saprospiraceae bacterium]|nr:thiol-disulfide oxidoreductase DCC family protein [Pyrinomonadaceae bacterium]
MSAVILFDGVCNFCNGAVNFVIEHDKAGYFKFSPLQSDAGEELALKYGIDRIETDSVILIEDERAYTLSTAALRIAGKLDGIWSGACIFMILPRAVRDLFYKLFAKYRYRLFGKQDSCMMPTPEIRERFLS